MLAGQLSLFYERSVSEHLSVVVGYGVGGNDGNFGRHLAQGGVVYQRATLEVHRYWPKKSILAGFYLGPYLRLSRLTVNNFLYDQQGKAIKDSQAVFLTTNKKAFVWIPGILVGRQLIVRWFSLDGFVGIQRQLVAGSVANGNQVVEGMTSPWALRLGLSAGVAF